MNRIRSLLQSPQPLKWLFYGDSLTEGSLHTFGYRDFVHLFVVSFIPETMRQRKGLRLLLTSSFPKSLTHK